MDHPAEGLFLGTIPIALGTIVYMMAQVVVLDHKQEWAVYVTWALWWLDVLIALLSSTALPIIMYVAKDVKSYSNVIQDASP